MRFKPLASLALAAAAPLVVSAQTPPTTSADIRALREEIEAMRTSYASRLTALEQRLQAAENAAKSAAPAPVDSAPSQSGSSVPLAPASTAGSGANAFNPSISMVLSGGYTRTTQDPSQYAITGFQLPGDSGAGPGSQGFQLAETELDIAANIDPWLRGATNISLHPDNSVSVEEAYVQTTSLSHGFSVKAGRFFSGVGYLNAQHAHTWDFVDNPLAYQALLGTQYGDDGLQVRWLAPLDQFLEIGAEVGRGRSFPGTDTSRNGAGMASLSLHTGGDVGESHSWRAGISVLATQADDQALRTMDTNDTVRQSSFSGDSRVWLLDGVWKWAPNGNATRTNFKLQGEYLLSMRRGRLTLDPQGASTTDSYRADPSGWYLQGIYQFMPGWRVGLRTERLDAGAPDYGLNASFLPRSAYQPEKNSVMVDFNPSEFSRLRVQFSRDASREGRMDDQFFLQYQMSLGAHGAHNY